MRDTRRNNLAALVTQTGGQAALAARLGRDRNQVYQWQLPVESKASRGIGDRVAREIERLLGLPPGWMDTDHAAAQAQVPSATAMTDGTAHATAVRVAADELEPGYVRLPLMDAHVAAGMAIHNPQFTGEVVAHVDVLKDWADRELRAPIGSIRVITARGDSMVPDVQDGDVLFVDTGITRYVSDAIYVITYAGRPMVKRLQARRDGSVLIRSSNPAYEPEIVPADEVDQLHVAGRVLAAWTLRRF